MKILLFLVLTLFSFNAAAQQTVTQVDDRIMIIRPVDNGDDIRNDENMPTCDNPKMVEQVNDAVREYLHQHEKGSIIEQRKRNLIIKYLDNFTEINIADFDNSKNYLVANELILTKINKNIKEQNMRLCVSAGTKPLYLLIYPEDFGYRVQILDFIAPAPEGNLFSVFYVPEVKQYEEFTM